MKWLKRIIVTIIVIVLLVIVAVGVFAATFDPNDYKDQIVAAVKDASGRELALPGEIGLSYFPRLGLRLGEARLSNAAGFGDKPFASVERLDVGVSAADVLRIARAAITAMMKGDDVGQAIAGGEVSADKVILAGLHLDLHKNEQGVTNWDDMLAKFGGDAEAEPEQPESGGAPAVALAVGGVEITDARVSWKDRQAGTDIAIAPLNLRTGALEPGKPFDLNLDFGLQMAAPKLDAKVDLATTVSLDLEANRYRLTGTTLNVEGVGDSLPGGRIEAALKSDIAADLNAGTAALAPLSLEALGLELNGEINASEITADPKLDGKLASNVFDLAAVLEALGQALPEGADASAFAQTQVTLAFNATSNSANVPEFSLSLGDIQLGGNVTAASFAPLEANGALRTSQLNPRALLATLGQQPPQTADPKVLSSAQLEAAFDLSESSASISALTLQLDDTRITGKASVQSFDAPKIEFGFAVDDIDLDRYLPPPLEGEGGGETSQPSPAGDDSLNLPVETMRGLNLDGQLAVGKLKMSNLRFSDVKATLSAKDGLISLNPVGLSLYQGSITGNTSVDVRNETPAFAAAYQLEGVEIGDLTLDLLGDEQAYLRGKTRLGFDLKTRGDRTSALTQQLDGTVSLAAAQGALRDAELARKVETIVAFLKGEEPKPAGEELVFDSLSANGVINKGVLQNDDLDLVTPLIIAKGKGVADLGQSSTDYELGIGLAGKERLVPLTVKGPFDNLKYGVDLKAFLEEDLKKELDAKKQELKARAEEEKLKLEAKAEEEKKKLEQKAEAKKQELEQKLEEKKQEQVEKLEDKVKDTLKDLKLKF